MNTIRFFSPKSGHFSRFSKKGKGGLHSTDLVVRPTKKYFGIVLQLVLNFLASEEKIVSFLWYKS